MIDLSDRLTYTPTTIECDACRGLMHYTTGNHFVCGCGDTWDAPWDQLLDLDHYLCEASRDHGDDVYALMQQASSTEPPHGDPDGHPMLQDLIEAFGLPFYVSDRIVIAWAVWQQDIYREEGYDL